MSVHNLRRTPAAQQLSARADFKQVSSGLGQSTFTF